LIASTIRTDDTVDGIQAVLNSVSSLYSELNNPGRSVHNRMTKPPVRGSIHHPMSLNMRALNCNMTTIECNCVCPFISPEYILNMGRQRKCENNQTASLSGGVSDPPNYPPDTNQNRKMAV